MAPEPETPKRKPAAPAPPPPPPPLPPMNLPPPPAQAGSAGAAAVPNPPAGQSDQSQLSDRNAPQPAMQDDDLIEKEWVTKAKQIVNKNRDDPYKQSEELTDFRANYMKKRYGKNIKLDK